MTPEGFIDYKKYIPTAIKPMEVMTQWGLREVIFDGMRQFYRFTDCTHPMQNAYCNTEYIKGWRYKNDCDNEALLIQPNHYERQKEGDEILNGIKLPTEQVLPIKLKLFWQHLTFWYYLIFRFLK